MFRLRLGPIVVAALALNSMVLPAQKAPALRTLVTFSGDSIQELSTSPNGRFVVLGTRSSLWMYETASKRSSKLTDGSAWQMKWSPRSDMIAYVQSGDGGSGDYVWALSVDPNTGRARGPAQRVTTGQGVAPAISPDGRWIAFVGLDSGQAKNLSVIPATGGPARVLAQYPSGILEEINWSADGKTIYFLGPVPGSTQPLGGVLRVRLSGGTPEVLRASGWFIAGMTADRAHLVLVPVKGTVGPSDHASIIDTTGREVGQVPLPVGSQISFDEVLGDSALIWWTHASHRMLEVRPVAGGDAKRLPLVGESSDLPLWSPDGRRIAFQVREGSRTSLAVINADGTNPRVFAQADVFPQQYGMLWSPDSRSIAFQSADRGKLLLLDIAGGTSRTIAEDSAGRFGAMGWRADGKGIVFARPNNGNAYRGSIDEVLLNGKRRELMPMVNVTGFAFVGGTSAFLRTDSAAYLRGLDSEQMRRLGAVPSGSRMIKGEVSRDLKWIFGVMGNNRRIELFSTETGVRSVVEVPFTLASTGIADVSLPGDHSFLVFGRRAGEEMTRIFRVPSNGSAPRAIADVGSEMRWMEALSVSPDGKLVVFPVQSAPPTQSLVLIDLRSALSGATSRPPRE